MIFADFGVILVFYFDFSYEVDIFHYYCLFREFALLLFGYIVLYRVEYFFFFRSWIYFPIGKFYGCTGMIIAYFRAEVIWI